MVKLDDDWIAWFVRQAAMGRETPQVWAPLKDVTVRHLQKLVKRYKDTGEVPYLNPNRRPKSPPLTQEEKRRIADAFGRTHRGPHKVWQELRRQGHRIPKHKVTGFMRARGWSKPNPKKQKKRTRVRYERDHSGSLIHGDYHETGDPDLPWVILWNDDASRLILSGAEATNATGEVAIQSLDAALKKAAEWGLRVRQVKTDKGSQFFANPQKGKKTGQSEFHKHLDALGIEFIPNKRNNPQSNGKNERLYLEYDRHRDRFPSLQGFLDWHNDQIHDALWIDTQNNIFETPNEAFLRKLPEEVKLRLHLRLVEPDADDHPTVEVIYAN